MCQTTIKSQRGYFWEKPVRVHGHDISWMLFGRHSFEAETNCASSHNADASSTRSVNNLSYFSTITLIACVYRWLLVILIILIVFKAQHVTDGWKIVHQNAMLLLMITKK